jgi:hypothetical protein
MKQKIKFERMNCTMKKLKVRRAKKSIAWLLTVAMVITMFSGMSVLAEPAFDSEKIIQDFNYLTEYLAYARAKDTEKTDQQIRLDDHHTNFVTKMVLPKSQGGDLSLLNAYNQFQLAEKYAQRIIDETLRNQLIADLASLAETMVNTYDEALDAGVASTRRRTFERRRNQLSKSVGLTTRNFGGSDNGGSGEQEAPPVSTYTVIFKDYDGTVLKTETVEEGSNATAPSNPTREGYEFTGWSIELTNVIENIEVVAEYEEVQTASTGPIPGTLLNIPVGGGYTFLGEVTTPQLFGENQTILDHFNPTGTNFNTDTNYLKFENTNGTILFVPKTPVKHSISWDAINGGNATQDPSNVNSGVYGAMQKTINGETYKIRLLKGANTNPSSGSDTARHDNSEWDHLLVALNTHNSSIYNDAYFGTGSGNGRGSWTQEQYESISSSRVSRGYYGLSIFVYENSFNTHSNNGWRPVLELVAD